ncbi:MAG TPA: choice-of-anchor D domain-containing protein, partial [Candidatus Eisenbacteria bacterium]|nr:choice-of-anchor D domain-containing protein [Candidatus Eisenbacteria bacterium]
MIFHDDMEGGLNGWTHAATAGGVDLWAQTTARSHSGTTSWRVQQHDVAGADALRSPAIDLTFRRDAVLAFQHWHRFDDCGGDPTFEPDGGVVEISTNGGATWTQITPIGGYPYVLDDICGNPLAFRQAYSHGGGIGAEFIPAVFDLTPFVGGEIVLRFHAGWDCGNCQTNEGWYIDDVTLYSSGPPILAVTPESGSVPAGSSLDLSARFDATGLFGGDYTMDVVVGSNDPDEGHVVVPASLHVTGVADIEVTPAALGFGTAFLGVGATDTLLVYNAGTDLLHVTGVSSDHAAFSAPAAPFDLAPGTVRELLVAFAPDAVGPFAAALTIASDDPDEAIVTVPLTGEGVIAPDIGIEPPALVVDLFTGDTAERTLTISNSGGSDLVVEISAKRPAAPLGLGFTPNPDPPPAASSLESRDDTTVEPSGAPGGANGPTPSILVIQNTSAWGVSMAQFIQANFGITATVIGSSQIASTDFAPYDLIVTVGDESSTYYGALSANVAKFEAYANAGGVIQYQLATQGNNVVLPRGAQALYGNIEYQNRVLLPNHPIVAGLPTTLNGSAANHNYLTSLPAGSQVITETYNSHQPTTVEYPVGDGMVVATGMTWEFLYFYNYDAGPMLYQATEYSLTKGLPRWISIAPPGATVPAG